MMRPKPKAPLSQMEKKIPVNPKYKNTQSKIDTGNTINKVRLISHKEFLKRRDETFRRITPRMLAELFIEYEEGGSEMAQPEMVAKVVKQADGSTIVERVLAEDNQVSGHGPRIVSYDAEEREEYDAPYLILDMRTKDEFAVNRMHRAKNFPASYLGRDILLPEMHQFKNHESKLIVLYDLDEKIIAQAAHTLVQRGFDNIYVLSGGLIDYAEEYPDHIEGLPLPRKPSDPKKKKGTRDVYKNASALTSSSSKSVKSASTRRRDGASDVSSVTTSRSVAESVISRATAMKGRGTTPSAYR